MHTAKNSAEIIHHRGEDHYAYDILPGTEETPLLTILQPFLPHPFWEHCSNCGRHLSVYKGVLEHSDTGGPRCYAEGDPLDRTAHADYENREGYCW